MEEFPPPPRISPNIFLPDFVPTRMKSILSLIGLALLSIPTLSAAPPTHELTAETAIKLIKEVNEEYQERVDIAMIVDGKARSGDFQLEHVRQVVALHPVPENGKRVKRMRTYQFQWSDDYGWFAWEKREERGVDVIYIWSELKGEVILR